MEPGTEIGKQEQQQDQQQEWEQLTGWTGDPPGLDSSPGSSQQSQVSSRMTKILNYNVPHPHEMTDADEGESLKEQHQHQQEQPGRGNKEHQQGGRCHHCA